MDSVRLQGFLNELTKIAVTRSVKEWRAANAAGDESTAGAIARASGQLGLKPRYLEDISSGGAEAGVDKLMGHAQSPTTGERNESGLLARKLYKPDSVVSRAEFTPQLLQQKQELTDKARALSPAAKAMVPDMYGHSTMNAGTPFQRTTSLHEFVPGLHDLRGKNLGTEEQPQWSRMPEANADVHAIKSQVLDPLERRHGVAMRDTLGDAGMKSHNLGNVVGSPQGPKVLDFLPQIGAQQSPAIKSMLKYAPTADSKFMGSGSVGALRKEVFKPTMEAKPADSGFAQQRMAELMHQANVGRSSPAQAPAGGAATGIATPAARGAQTNPVTPAARAAARPMIPVKVHPDPFPSSTASFLHGAGAATKGFFGRAAAHI